MARKSASGVTVLADFSAVTKFIGAGKALLDSVQPNARYLDNILKYSFEAANNEFNLEAAAVAASGEQGIRHMFEWGTAGINRGRSNMRPSPTSEQARLWKTTLGGSSKNRTLRYEFKPSVAYVPKPTARRSGMDPAVIDQMRDHVFVWKAMVMETGMEVVIKPKDAKFLLIPYYEGAYGFRPNDKKRGYILSKGPIYNQPGRNSRGKFTSYWTNFWEGRGNEMMNKFAQEQVEADFYPELSVNSNGVPVLAGKTDIDAQVETARRDVNKKALIKAKGRKVSGNE